jgi:glyceraldehyde 3-phosphate dehydrogenase
VAVAMHRRIEKEKKKMTTGDGTDLKLGVNGFGRVGKLAVWHNLGRKYFKEIVVNIGREVGISLEDVAHYMERDSTYGLLQGFLYGHRAEPVIEEIDEENGIIRVNGMRVRFLRTTRNPAEIGWNTHGVRLVVDTAGKFLDPTLDSDDPGGSVRGHLESGAEKVIVSAPFKIKDDRIPMPEDAITTIMGINENDYDPRRHKIISNASCTTTCLSHMIKPLLNHFGPKRVLSASMATIHAVTGSQEVLDRMPKEGASDLRKNRSVMNNIILTTTGAAKALSLVIPEMEQIGFIAESVRIPITTGSLIILVMNIQEELSGEPVRAELIKNIYQKTASQDPKGYLLYTDKQNVSCDIIGIPRAGAIIEGHETHTRTAEVTIDLAHVPGLGKDMMAALNDTVIRIPVTQSVIYGWYDNEMGGYVNMLCDRTESVAEDM